MVRLSIWAGSGNRTGLLMAPKHSNDEESEEPASGGLPATTTPSTKARRQSFGALRRQLSDDELAGTGVQKMLLDEIDRLESELVSASEMADRFHGADKDAAILREKFKSHTSHEIISTASLTVGSVALGIVFGIEDNATLAWIILAGGVILILAGLWAKKVKI